MMRNLLALTLFAVAAGGCGCGNLSEEDLVFAAGIPSKAELELRPAGAASAVADDGAGTARQALTVAQAEDAACADGDLRCNAQQTAKGVNGLTFGLLDLIDHILQQPPSARAPGKRVWGPFFVADKNQTARFEITRNGGDADFAFTFCLHAVDGFVGPQKAKHVDCSVDVDDDSGLALILSGNFTPGDLAGARARSGHGNLDLRTDRVRDFGNVAHDLAITFDNRSGAHITMELHGLVFNGVEEPNALTYEFDREEDGSGDLDFAVVGDIAKQSARLERLQLRAVWDRTQAGRAEGIVSGGDVGATDSAFEKQCWDGDGAQVYVEYHVPPDQNATDGDVGLCVFDEADLPVP